MLTVSVHLREGQNKTNIRSESIAMGLEKLGCKIVCLGRANPPCEDADLIIQTGMTRTPALMHCLRHGIPYIIAEAPFYRMGQPGDYPDYSSWGYGGLAGGAWHPETPKGYPAHDLIPDMRPKLEEEGRPVIIAQKPTDHSLRGADHNAWLEEKLRQYPSAKVRPHPLMYQGPLPPLDELIETGRRIVTYTSTVGAEALIHGAPTTVDHWGSIAYDFDDGWHHRLAWKHGPHTWLMSRECAEYILSGYDEAKKRAELGQQETPRTKIGPVYEYSETVRSRF